MAAVPCQHQNRACGFCDRPIFQCKCEDARRAQLAICDECKVAERARHDRLAEFAPVAKAAPVSVSRCRACQTEIVWLKTRAGKAMPVNLLPTAKPFRGPNAGEELFVYGAHQPHFVTCPKADEFRKPR